MLPCCYFNLPGSDRPGRQSHWSAVAVQVEKSVKAKPRVTAILHALLPVPLVKLPTNPLVASGPCERGASGVGQEAPAATLLVGAWLDPH